MPDLKDKKELAQAARSMAEGFELVHQNGTLYVPVGWFNMEMDPPPAVGEAIWIPLNRHELLELANDQFNVLFANDGEARSFEFMLKQFAKHGRGSGALLIRTDAGLKTINAVGQLIDHDGSFSPNFLGPTLNEDPSDKEEVWKTIVEWLGGSEDEAHSLLHHLATALAPGWSAVKYVLLIGEGRNGKGVLLAMLTELFGDGNISSISRQAMAERSPTCVELNNKLLNIIFDGEMGYIKDSSAEKTLIAGEPLWVRMLYESGTTRVQTNALFIEGLNFEPKARDKSPALQKRLIRYSFPNVYPMNPAFHSRMTGETMVGALLSLLLDHFVQEKELAIKLAPTKKSTEMQYDQVWINSPILQFLESLYQTDPKLLDRIGDVDFELDKFLNSFKPWAQTQGLPERSDGDLLALVRQSFNVKWKAKRENGKVKNRKVLGGYRPETLIAIEQITGGTDGDETAVVED